MRLRIGSLASGIGGDAVAWHPLGWETAFFSEIEPFASAVLAHRFQGVPNLGDFTAPDFAEWARARGPVDVLAAGTPCQAFSVAGKRGSLKDDRGNLTLRFVEVVHELDPTIVVWENVPGVLSTDDNAFGCFLAGMVGASEPLASGLDGGRWPNAGMVVGPRRSLAWRILDAQYLGLAQRRRRVCVVSFRARDRTNPGAVLFEPESLRRDPPARREEGAGVTPTLAPGAHPGGCTGYDAENGMLIAGSLSSHHGRNAGEDTYVAAPITASGAKHGGCAAGKDSMPHNLIYQCHPTQSTSAENRANPQPGDSAPTLAKGGHAPAVALTCGDRGISPDQACAGMIQPAGLGVRRLTPRECERIQGFPDDYTLVPYRGRPPERCADGPRYRALGNAWAVPVFTWIGRRIEKVLEAREAVK